MARPIYAAIMMNEDDFAALVTRIRNSLGCSRDLAVEYAKTIGSSPEIVHGKILVRNENARVIAYIPESVLK